MAKCCAQCQFYQHIGGDLGQCRFNPPATKAPAWPTVQNGEWCGKWEPRVSATTNKSEPSEQQCSELMRDLLEMDARHKDELLAHLRQIESQGRLIDEAVRSLGPGKDYYDG